LPIFYYNKKQFPHRLMSNKGNCIFVKTYFDYIILFILLRFLILFFYFFCVCFRCELSTILTLLALLTLSSLLVLLFNLLNICTCSRIFWVFSHHYHLRSSYLFHFHKRYPTNYYE